ncbi:hypothetical protein ABZ915_32255 [Streptomyces sp. NPDC046915]|uniref:hypothetical protein n=1 Tax=Streptomyces sp. NPDC046915 TaxID=3155257 RepID=UPI0033FCB259
MTDVTRHGATPPATEKQATEKQATVNPATEKPGTETPAAEARRAEPPAPPSPSAPPAPSKPPAASAASLVPHEETDKFGLRLQQAVSGFVDEPRDAVEEADRVVEEIAARFTEAVGRRRRTLRMSWQSADDKPGSTADTEQLRLALRDYRELAERLLRL